MTTLRPRTRQSNNRTVLFYEKTLLFVQEFPERERKLVNPRSIRWIFGNGWLD
jgi:hypothetical protein